jgi:hypothetical protein
MLTMHFVASLSVWRDLKMIEKAKDFCRREEIEMECNLQLCFERLKLNGCGVSVERRFT